MYVQITKEYEAGIVTTDDIACGNMLYPTCPIARPFGEVKCSIVPSFLLMIIVTTNDDMNLSY